MQPQQIAMVVVGATLGVLILLVLVYGRPRRDRQEPPPANFHRGDPDSVLEGARLHRIQTWGLASAVFIAGFLSIYFVIEPFREAQWDKKFLRESIERGREEFVQGVQCAACHGPEGGGGFASTDPTWPAPPLNNELHRYTRTEVRRIIEMGRPGTPMPAWGVNFGGPLNDQRLDDVVNFLESIQLPADKRWELPATVTEGQAVFAQKCAVCHGPDALGRSMGRPLPTFYAPDLTTEFYRMGLQVLQNQAMTKDPSLTKDAARAAAIASPLDKILAAGEEASRSTIEKGRPNTPMPAWKNRIRPEQVDAVVAYLKSIQKKPS